MIFLGHCLCAAVAQCHLILAFSESCRYPLSGVLWVAGLGTSTLSHFSMGTYRINTVAVPPESYKAACRNEMT